MTECKHKKYKPEIALEFNCSVILLDVKIIFAQREGIGDSRI